MIIFGIRQPDFSPLRTPNFADIKPSSFLNEFAGAFGDIGTFLPLMIGMAAFSKVNLVTSILIFGFAYIISGAVFNCPIPIQPMKVIAVITIATGASLNIISGAGLAIGGLFLIASLSGSIDCIKRVVSKSVVIGIQMGLGLVLLLKSVQLVGQEMLNINLQFLNWVVFLASILIAFILFSKKKLPAMFGILGIGLLSNLTLLIKPFPLIPRFSFPFTLSVPTFNDLLLGFVLLTIPQIPVTLGNSVLATESLAGYYFPNNKRVKAKSLALSVGVMNMLSALFGGIPMCHGAGGLAGHYRFGARKGIATISLGILLLVISLFYGSQLISIMALIPFPILGAILFFASVELLRIVKETHFASNSELLITIMTAVICVVFPYGFAVGLILGILTTYISRKKANFTY